MPAPLSLDLRQRILDASRTLSASKTAERFSVGIRTVQRIQALDKATGSIAPKTPKTKGRAPILGASDRAFFENLIAEDVSMTQAEMARRFTEETKRPVARPTVAATLAKWGITRKKRARAPRSASAKTS
jgi:transposase